MAMFRGSAGVTGVIQSITFSAKEFKGQNGPYHKLSAEILLLPDGAKVAQKRFSDAGFFYPANQSISKDGKTLSSKSKDGKGPGGPVIGKDTYFAKLILSAIDNGFPQDRFDPNGFNFSALEGARVTISNQVDVEATAKLGNQMWRAETAQLLIIGDGEMDRRP